MAVGIGFIVIGIFIYVRESYNMDIIDGEKVFSKKEDLKKDRAYRYKMLVAIFSVILGGSRILNAIIY